MAKIKVSQATIDNIKKMGMTKALAGAAKANPEMKEALTRMYGAKRVSAAGGKATSVAAKSPDAARASASKTTKAVARSADAARMANQKKTTTKTTTKKSGTTDPFARFVFGVGRAAAEPFTSKPKPKK